MAARLHCPRPRGGWSPGALGAASNPLKAFLIFLEVRDGAVPTEEGGAGSIPKMHLVATPAPESQPKLSASVEGVGWNVLVDEGTPAVETS